MQHAINEYNIFPYSLRSIRVLLPESFTNLRLSYARHLKEKPWSGYCEPLITRHMKASGSPFGVKIDEKNRS
jgi:hypothetical protein